MAGMGPDRLALAAGTDPPPLLPMSRAEEAQADLWSTGVSVHHPVEFVRERLAGAGCISIAEALGGRVHGRRVRIGGVITHRQRPMTARGVIFLNLEDETGLLNVIVLPGVWQANREVARRSIGVILDGVLEHRDGVTNLVARRFTAWSEEVTGLHSRDWARGR
jgi:error-prone DNA polymerase